MDNSTNFKKIDQMPKRIIIYNIKDDDEFGAWDPHRGKILYSKLFQS